MKFNDKIQVNNKSATIMRDGTYVYQAREIGDTSVPPDELIVVHRPAEEIIKAYKRFRDLGKLPITVNHPSEFVNLNDESSYKSGEAREPEYKKVGPYSVIDCQFELKGDALVGYNNGTKELSCGWEGDFVPSNDNRYKYIQVFKDINHIAMVDRGRCGDLCKINDGGIMPINDVDPVLLEEGRKVEEEHIESLKELYKMLKENPNLTEADFVSMGVFNIANDHLKESDLYYAYLQEMEKNIKLSEAINDGGNKMSKEMIDKKITDQEEEKKEKEKKEDEGAEKKEEENKDGEGEENWKEKYEDLKKKYDELMEKEKKTEDEEFENKESEEQNEDEDEEEEEKKKEDKKKKDKKNKDAVMFDKVAMDKAVADAQQAVIKRFADVIPILKTSAFKAGEVIGKTPCEIKAMFVKKFVGKEVKVADEALDTAFEMAKKFYKDKGWVVDSEESEKTIASVIDSISLRKEEK